MQRDRAGLGHGSWDRAAWTGVLLVTCIACDARAADVGVNREWHGGGARPAVKAGPIDRSGYAPEVYQPLNEQALKGTHNSYVCDGECGLFTCDLDSPLMGHSPVEQVDDFGAYEIELDWSVEVVDGAPRALVGHDGPGHGGRCWGSSLQDYLIDLRDHCRSLPYRPLFIFFEKKGWGAPEYSDPGAWQPLLRDVLLGVFSDGQLMTEEEFASLRASLGRFPSIPELAGRVLPFAETSGFPASARDQCTDLGTVLSERDGSGIRVFRLDQYMTDWTFSFCAPPNPLVVDLGSPALRVVSGLDNWDQGPCPNGDRATGNVVHQQGTFLLPFSTIRGAVARAAGVVRGGVTDPLTAGKGWTVLVRPGLYVEGPQVIRVPLRLVVDPASNGVATIR